MPYSERKLALRERQDDAADNQGKLVEAEEMYRRALDGKEKAWGLDHTSTLTGNTVNNLGLLYADQRESWLLENVKTMPQIQ
ncbi:hypothetical protein N7G274_004829 [Stereocaulon virgatum]|uniref:Uncharacterized protein n=1 Tax=Stereocaulon virgatum TaxID=373712 RepID=A0ABR4AA46_9LECA